MVVIFLGIFWVICQLNNPVYGYTLDEVKDKIHFTTIEETGEPDDFDVFIDGTDLISNEKLPCIETSIDTVLYGEDDITDIDFFEVISTNENEVWKNLSEVIKNFFRITLYIGLAATLTLLIYMAVVLVYTTISKKDTITLPLANTFQAKKGDNPEKYSKEKRFIEQWIMALLSLALLPFVLNLVIGFSSMLTEITDRYQTDEAEGNTIVVYVKNSTGENNTNMSYTFETNLEGLFMFQSQYNWQEYGGTNIVNMISGLIITLFKIGLYALFIGRMLVIAILTAFSPILLLINAVMKINGNKGFLKDLVILYVYFVLLKPIIGILYYLFAKSNVYLVSQNPFYVLFIIAALVALIWFSIQSIQKNFAQTKKKNIANKRLS